jgi:hypothetical protein
MEAAMIFQYTGEAVMNDLHKRERDAADDCAARMSNADASIMVAAAALVISTLLAVFGG